MKRTPIAPARIDFGAAPDEPPRAPDFGDLYHPRIGAAAQARHVFLHGNGLPARWAGRASFTVLETGFGLGNNFLATWDAWRADPARPRRLAYVAIECHPPRRDDLVRAHGHSPWPEAAAALCAAWPPLVAGLHPIDFDDARVQLLLAFGDVAELLPALRLAADAFFLDGFAPACNPAMWSPQVLAALGRRAAPGATLATWSVARALHDGLAAAGFVARREPGIGGKREVTVAHWAPAWTPRGAPPAGPRPPGDAVVVGAGVAGAGVAQALARLGARVQVLDRHPAPATEASGNPAGLFHATVGADEGRYARLYRAAALLAQREFGPAIAAGVPGRAGGLLRLERQQTIASMRALLQRQGLPEDWAQALDIDAAAVRAGVALPGPAWLQHHGGWIAPAAWVRHALATPGVTFFGGVEVGAIERDGVCWRVLAADGRPLASAPVLVLANAADSARLLAPLGLPPWPLAHSRGQVTWWPDAPTLGLPLAGDGYALSLPDGRLLCGATRGEGAPDGDLAPRPADHGFNLHRLQRLTGLRPPAGAILGGRVGWRLHSADRLPIAGMLPIWPPETGRRSDPPRRLPRHEGLGVLTALGSRGLTLAPLLARLVAAQTMGMPWPLEQDLADAVDPARWLVRAARREVAAKVQPG